MADPEVDLFAGMKKKKKKQVALDVGDSVPAEQHTEQASASKDEQEPKSKAPVAAVQEPTPPAPVALADATGEAEAVEGEGGDMFADMKKKKKKKEMPLDLESTPAATDTPATLDGLDVPMKKKKSRKQASDFAKELDELEAGDAADEVDAGGEDGDPFASGGAGEKSEGPEAWVVEGREATYPELLKRFFTLLHAHNPELAGEKRRYTIVPPQVAREGTKKTTFSNISDICRRMHRQPEHVIQFLYAELGTTGSVDAAQRLVMKGRFTQKQIENLLRKYIVEYVTCKICKSPDTLLGKENRLYFMTCESCGSRLSVSAIKAGYQAQIGKRVKAP